MRRTLASVIALLALGLSACGGSSTPAAEQQPAVAAFADGTCRVAAPDVLTIGKVGARLGNDNTISADAKAALKEAQTSLRTLAEGAEPTYQPAFSKLVESTGFVRIRADGNSYEPALGAQLMKDYAAVLKVCGAAQ